MAGVFIPAGALMLSFFSRGGGNAVAFGFCARLIFALVAAFSFGFSRVLYPEFSRDGRAQLSHSFVRALRSCGLLILLFTPVIAAVFIKGETVFSAFFMRGRFDENAVALLARAFRGAVFSVPALCVCEIMSKLCFACGIKWAPGVCNIIGIAVTFFMLLGFSGSDIVMPAASFSVGRGGVGTVVNSEHLYDFTEGGESGMRVLHIITDDNVGGAGILLSNLTAGT